MNNPQKIKTTEAKKYFEYNNTLKNIDLENIDLSNDKKALKSLFLDEINPNTVFFHNLEEKIEYLINNEYIKKDRIELYDFEFIKDLTKHIYSYKFRFKSFMGAYKFYKQYALTTNDGKRYLERYEDRIVFVALDVANGDKQLAWSLAEEMINQRFQPATPTFLSSMKVNAGEKISCFLLDIQDNMDSIAKGITGSLQLSKRGGGVGINLSNIRESGAPIKKIENASSGVVPIMKLLEDSFSYANQLGQRNGAGAVYLNVFHPDIVSFLSTKKENADEKIRVKTLSLGLVVPDKFYHLIKSDDIMYLFSPYDVEREYGVPFSYVDITKEYDNMVLNDNIRKSKIRARELEQEISKLQQESGYPYILNIDTVNNNNNVNGKVIMSNICTEITQIQTPSVLNRDQSYDVVGHDVSCNLGSLNAVNLINSPNFAKTIDTSIRALTNVSSLTSIEEVPTVKHGNEDYHSVGLGLMNLHGLFALNKILYGSKQSLELTDMLFKTIRYYTLYTSNQLAKETNTTFKDFDKSKYATGEFFDNILEDYCSGFVYKKIENIFINANIEIPTRQDWLDLKQSVMEFGLYNSYTMTVAPTGSISYINESTASIHPITQIIEERQEKKTGKTYYPAPYLSDDTVLYYQSAYDIDMRKVIDVYATAQKWVDQSMSLTLFMRSEIPKGMYEWKNNSTNKMTTRDLNILRNYAWKKGIKSLYYVRTFTEDVEIGGSDCESCSV